MNLFKKTSAGEYDEPIKSAGKTRGSKKFSIRYETFYFILRQIDNFLEEKLAAGQSKLFKRKYPDFVQFESKREPYVSF